MLEDIIAKEFDGDFVPKLRPVLMHVVKTIIGLVESDGDIEQIFESLDFDEVMEDFLGLIGPLLGMGEGSEGDNEAGAFFKNFAGFIEMLQKAVPELMEPNADIESILMNVRAKYLLIWVCFG